ncbi:hypothetical protein BV898_03573 [Hypsibius exemplaris]|uniref:Uncharacterized protein n=1 Tax=Hypsibius exemplaris TaxID=2072580 RepID=A0A1W0X4C8_HYPEX|nr:hypothetical protein BV898_03573 [Hypsibius exemplaris]
MARWFLVSFLVLAVLLALVSAKSSSKHHKKHDKQREEVQRREEEQQHGGKKADKFRVARQQESSRNKKHSHKAFKVFAERDLFEDTKQQQQQQQKMKDLRRRIQLDLDRRSKLDLDLDLDQADITISAPRQSRTRQDRKEAVYRVDLEDVAHREANKRFRITHDDDDVTQRASCDKKAKLQELEQKERLDELELAVERLSRSNVKAKLELEDLKQKKENEKIKKDILSSRRRSDLDLADFTISHPRRRTHQDRSETVYRVDLEDSACRGANKCFRTTRADDDAMFTRQAASRSTKDSEMQKELEHLERTMKRLNHLERMLERLDDLEMTLERLDCKKAGHHNVTLVKAQRVKHAKKDSDDQDKEEEKAARRAEEDEERFRHREEQQQKFHPYSLKFEPLHHDTETASAMRRQEL